MGVPYKHARLKTDRAKKHIDDFSVTVVDFETRCTSTIENDVSTGGQLLIHEIPNPGEMLEQLSLITGDAIHNLKCALDFAWNRTISRLLPDKLSRNTLFPVRDTRQDLVNALHGIEVDTRCLPLFNCILSDIQPYKGGKSSIVWTLHDLDIFDKHLLVLALSPRAQITGITLRDVDGKLRNTLSVQAEGMNGRYLFHIPPQRKVEDKGHLSAAVTMQEAGVFYSLPVEGLLSQFRNFVLYSIQLLENL
jgi:hypothetical protein